MRPAGWLCCCIAALAATATANVEKTIFVAPRPVELPNEPILDSLYLDALSAAHASPQPVLETQLPVAFPSPAAPRGVASWYLLQDLDEGRRYEVRICWPATSPTDFWLETFTPSSVLEQPHLLSSLSQYSKGHDARQLRRPLPASSPLPPSVLFLRLQAAASYYSPNSSLMDHPPPVTAHIILDPFVLNILPRSLLPIGAYIIAVTVGAWFLSGAIYKWLRAVAAEPLPKLHEHND